MRDAPRPPILAALACASALFGSGFATAEPLGRVDIGARAPAFSAKGSDGRRHRLSDYTGKVVVLEWTSPACPFTQMKYAGGAMQALQAKAAAQGVAWLSIDTAAPDRAGYLTAAAARTRVAKTHARITAFLFDVDGRIGRAFGARTTPSFFIVGPGGKLLYEGAMDDAPSGETANSGDYVKAALDDIAAGRPVGTAETQPYGCAVEY
jgi:hypothetical protein